MLASSWLDLNTDQDRIDENRSEKNFDDDNFRAFRPNYDRRAVAHQMVTGHNTTTHHMVRRNNAQTTVIPIISQVELNSKQPIAKANHLITKRRTLTNNLPIFYEIKTCL